LSRSTKLLDAHPASDDHANYVRCISGAYHNLAGTLYQGGKHVGAVRFLKEGCALGGKALVIRFGGGGDEGRGGGEEKGEEGWKLLREQLYRRWELLGICYSKMGDRRVSTTFIYFFTPFSWVCISFWYFFF
jgi:separase